MHFNEIETFKTFMYRNINLQIYKKIKFRYTEVSGTSFNVQR